MGAVSPQAKAKSQVAKAAYAKTPQGKFSRQKAQAKARGVEFSLTFEQWWKLWADSGRYAEMGRGLECWCMGRKGDSGPYAEGNVEIISVKQNLLEQMLNGKHTTNHLTNQMIKQIISLRDQGLTQDLIAEKVGVGQPYVSRVLSGKRGSLLME